MFVTVVNAIVAGTLGALIALAAQAPVWLIAVIGAVSGLAYLAATIGIAMRRFGSNSIESRFPSPG
jgi:hypothetical protein